TAVEATTTTASIPASIKVNGETVPVTSVGENAMKDNKTVKTVKLADTITSIGEGAFSGASSLKTIKLSANITEIAPGAFDGIKSNATFVISAATDEEYEALIALLKKSGIGSKIKFKRA
ncbi:MAG: leucine-rich repeat domain-containing protein, partial [Lachnospiraceae bacterium]|nr:leucine-rich repeat domain-containing protein [Lachnospiraceae bacterium]MCR4721207.1 leucine-rich repeat domain-containing protein [Lachnospiraceae bacterium]